MTELLCMVYLPAHYIGDRAPPPSTPLAGGEEVEECHESEASEEL